MVGTGVGVFVGNWIGLVVGGADTVKKAEVAGLARAVCVGGGGLAGNRLQPARNRANRKRRNNIAWLKNLEQLMLQKPLSLRSGLLSHPVLDHLQSLDGIVGGAIHPQVGGIFLRQRHAAGNDLDLRTQP